MGERVVAGKTEAGIESCTSILPEQMKLLQVST